MAEKDRRRFMSLGNVLTILGMLGAVAASYGTLSADNARQKERVDTLKEETKEIKKDVKDTKESVNLILQHLKAMEARREADREHERERNQRRQ